ncbi:MAG: LacI family transcriptional regulator [Burkholderiales bacterium]
MNRSIRRPTLSDVAKLAGVSLGSASRALSVPDQVKAGTLEQVNWAVAQLGYVRNGTAQALASRRTRTIAAIYPTLNNPIYANSVDALQQTLWKLGYQLLIASHEYDAQREVQVTRAIVERGIDGVIFVGTDHDEGVFTLVKQRNLPYVLTWSTDESSYPHCVGFSNYDAAYQMAKRVVAKGHRKIALCGGATRHNERARARIAGTLAALAEARLLVPVHWIIEQPFSFEGGRAAIQQLWSGSEQPTALICGTDLQAIGALHQCQTQGIDVPSTLSITGFDDIELAGLTTPPLTTVRVPTLKIGVGAAQKIVALIENKALEAEEPLVATVVERGSLGER